jgi:hypothetical protein
MTDPKNSFYQNFRSNPSSQVFPEKFPLIITTCNAESSLRDDLIHIINKSEKGNPTGSNPQRTKSNRIKRRKHLSDIKIPQTVKSRLGVKATNMNIFAGGQNKNDSLISVSSVDFTSQKPAYVMHKRHTSFQWIADQALDLAKRNNPHPINMQMADCWGGFYTKGQHIIEHDHWPYLWSWIYYVKCCDDCTPLVFDNGLGEQQPLELTPKEDNMVMFPSLISHSVPPHGCNHDRIVIAGNISFVPPYID